MMLKVTVLFFATLRERAGMKKIQMEIPDGTTIDQFKELLGGEIPELIPAMDSTLFSINKEFAFGEEILSEGAEIALFPPVSGGVQKVLRKDQPSYFSIQESEIDIDELIDRITTTTTGAVCVFTGIVRGKTLRGEPFDTEYLEYEAYKEMANDKMQQVAREIWGKWPDVEGINNSCTFCLNQAYRKQPIEISRVNNCS